MSGTATTQGMWAWCEERAAPEIPGQSVLVTAPLSLSECALIRAEDDRRRDLEIEACRLHLRDLIRFYTLRR